MQYLTPGLVANYTCGQCGRCCYGWKIEVSPQEFKDIMLAIKQLPAEQRPDFEGFDFEKDDMGKIESCSFKMNEENHCGFLGENRLCYIHAQFGQKLKPLICISYPFYAIKTPQNTYINISFSCFSAIQFLITDNPCQSVWPPNNLGAIFSTKMDVSEQKCVHIAPGKAISWPCFYTLQNYIATQVHNPILFSVGFWHCIRQYPTQNLTVEQMTALFPQIIPDHLSLTNSRLMVAHLENIFTLLDFWSVRCQCDHSLLLPVGELRKRLGYETSVTEKFSLAYSHALQEANIFRPALRQILLNYAYIKLWMNDYYFIKNILEGMSITATGIGLIVLLALTNTQEHEQITETTLCQSINDVERLFFHSDIFSYQMDTNVDPAIGFGLLFTQWPPNAGLVIG